MPNNGINKKSGLTYRIIIDYFQIECMFSVYRLLEKDSKNFCVVNDLIYHR